MIRSQTLSCLVVVIVITAAGCATVPPEEDPVLIKLTELENRIQRIERVVNNNSLVDLLGQVDELRAGVGELRGEVETLRFEAQGAAKRQRDQYLDIDQRLQSIEQSDARGAADGGTEPPDRVAYKQGFDLLQARRYDEAKTAFGQFAQQYPDSPLVDNAHYWLAEAYYVTGEYDDAIKEFQIVLDDFPQSAKSGDAMLKIGYGYYEKKDWKSARDTLAKVIETYPDSTPARLAQQRIERLTREGH